eukprot:scaffold1513_cov100-Amphora_coffeaeformis.AAC.23
MTRPSSLFDGTDQPDTVVVLVLDCLEDDEDEKEEEESSMRMTMEATEWPETNTENRTKRISFSRNVAIRNIPNRYSYTPEEKRNLWVANLAQHTERNLLEFAAEGWFWPDVVEEEHMVSVNGMLVHPIHLNPLLKDALRRQIPYPRAVTPPEEDDWIQQLQQQDEKTYYYEDLIIERPSSPFVGTQLWDDEDEERMIREDPDGYLRKRFAHHSPSSSP